MKEKSEVTKLLVKVQKGDGEAYDQLFPLIYSELKRLAYSKLQDEHNDITVSETELVHEVYLKMVDQTSIKANDKNHFLAIAARCMRQILIDHARKKKAKKRGGEKKDVTYIDKLLKLHHEAEELINLDNKLKKLAKLDQRMADVVTFRFFGQMSNYEIAKTLEISERTVRRDWTKARGWLYKEIKNQD
ncbi:RNA polymerase subunit sigma-70 [Aliifodinibius salipaludis]|uniref:RNA polymerase subunit sigma-70 n=1 Tax=Fodinibius salipaludis TaxID=2032627 RepID=A0A2A2G9U8_9BACT|nr:ECF-type sigma factor [Aliifodinibius salipaludis]PAU93629.1 RNA polymerase subunit sigma-70 [Aliifodinibius salipaludis]